MPYRHPKWYSSISHLLFDVYKRRGELGRDILLGVIPNLVGNISIVDFFYLAGCNLPALIRKIEYLLFAYRCFKIRFNEREIESLSGPRY